MEQINLVKSIKNQQTGEYTPQVVLSVNPTISKFGTGNDRFQWTVSAVVNGQFVNLGYFTDRQLESLAHRILEAVQTKRIACKLMGEQFVENSINQMYAMKQAQRQNLQTANVQYNPQTVPNQTVPNQTVPTNQQPANTQPANNIPNINTV